MKSKILEKVMKVLENNQMYPPVNNIKVFALGASGFAPRFGGFYNNLNDAFFMGVTKGETGIAYFDENQFTIISDEVFSNYWKDEGVLEKRKSLTKEVSEKINKLYHKVGLGYVSQTGIDDLIKDVKEIVENSRIFQSISLAGVVFDKEVCLGLIKKLDINISEERLDVVWYKGTTSAGDSFDKKRFKIVLNYLSEGMSWDDIAERCQYFLANHNTVESVSEVRKQLIEEYGKYENSSELGKAIELERASEEKRACDFEKWTGKLSEEEKKLVRYMQEIIELRDRKKDSASKALSVHFRVAQKMFREAKLSEEFIYFYLYEEVLKGQNHLLDIKDEFAERKRKGFAVLMNFDGSIDVEVGTTEEIRETLEDLYLKKYKKDGDTIRGQVGASGKVSGVVKIVRDPNKADHFNNGDILVTGMTRPEFLPLMKKAAAFVTDEGGITCHAAIVARELGKPCVIGTKVATRVLKDGDLVEVDADKGVVRILPRK